MWEFNYNHPSLQSYISDNYSEIYDYFANTKYEVLMKYRVDINKMVLFRRTEIESLDLSADKNISFILLLIDTAERMRLLGAFGILFTHLNNKNVVLGKRLEASSLFIMHASDFNDYYGRYEEIINLLQEACETEEDSFQKVLSTFANYYSHIMNEFAEFNQAAVASIQRKIWDGYNNKVKSFLDNKFIEEMLRVDISDGEIAYTTIQNLIDRFITSEQIVRADLAPKKQEEAHVCIIESAGDYAVKLNGVNSSFPDIREISCDCYKLIRSDELHSALGRGVKVLETENELIAYMYSYGMMHYVKILEAVKELPENQLSEKLEIIDWACGQGIASMALFDYIRLQNINHNICKIKLIEPSEIALKRAALHVNKYYPLMGISTIKKEFDLLSDADLDNSENLTKIHLFSNILDIELFSLTHLIKKIVSNYLGQNIFICASPFISVTRTSRLDAFEEYFYKYHDFKEINRVDQRAGEWINGWSRVLRIFMVTL